MATTLGHLCVDWRTVNVDGRNDVLKGLWTPCEGQFDQPVM